MGERGISRTCAMDELTGWSLTQFAFWSESIAPVADAYHRVFGEPMPARVGDVSAKGPVSAIRVGPDRIWIVDDAGNLASLLAGAVDRRAVSVTELTHGRCRFRLTGPRACDVLATGIALDLDEAALPPGQAAQTMLHRISVLLHRLGEQAFDLYVPRSFAVNIREWLADAAHEAG
jgi:sarcosine oxidase subunit gamma